MYKMGLIKEMVETFPERRDTNSTISKEAILVLVVLAKLQKLCAITDVPVATRDIDILERLGFELKVDKEEFMSEGAIRAFVEKYKAEEIIEFYNKIVQKIIEKMNYKNENSNHQFDSTELEVRLKNDRYEKSEVTKNKEGQLVRGYKLNCSRLMLPQGGLIEQISMSSIKVHDLESSRSILENPYYIKENDLLIYDRGYIDRKLINKLKNEKGISVIVPARKDMDIFEKAIKIAKEKNEWKKHPNGKRKGQEISLVKGLGGEWTSKENVYKKIEKENKEDVELIGCVIRIGKENKNTIEEEITKEEGEYKYIVLISSDIKLTAGKIVRNYETRPEIEEDFRQLKDVWGIQNFKSTKYLFIVFHIVTMLLGYLFYIVYKNTKEGLKYKNQTLETILKNRKKKLKERFKSVKELIVFSKKEYGIVDFGIFLDIYADSSDEIRIKIKKVIKCPKW